MPINSKDLNNKKADFQTISIKIEVKKKKRFPYK